MRKILVFVLFAVLFVTLAGCTPAANVNPNDKANVEIQFTTPV